MCAYGRFASCRPTAIAARAFQGERCPWPRIGPSLFKFERSPRRQELTLGSTRGAISPGGGKGWISTSLLRVGPGQ
eukprot:4706372-Pyramimonas_sp.AAC.1